MNQKIANMFLSVLTNPGLYRGGGHPPWSEGLDRHHFVVIDSNVDLFLAAIGYPGPWTYDARRAFVQALAARIDLSPYSSELEPYNPRLLQQAIYLVMSRTNRRADVEDCSYVGAAACGRCDVALRTICPLRGR